MSYYKTEYATSDVYKIQNNVGNYIYVTGICESVILPSNLTQYFPITITNKTTNIITILDDESNVVTTIPQQETITTFPVVGGEKWGFEISSSSGGISGGLNMDNHKILNLATPTASTDAATKGYVDAGVASSLSLDGTSTMAGTINMGNFKITNVAAPTATTDATTKTYVDEGLNLRMPLNGGNFTGGINMNNKSITNVIYPINAADAATKVYVDASVGVVGTVLFNYSVPIMTSSTTPVPYEVSRSGGGAGYLAFDRNMATQWVVGLGTTGTLTLKLPAGEIFTAFEILSATSYFNLWNIQGSYDNITYKVLFTGFYRVPSTLTTFYINSPGPYQYYRFSGSGGIGANPGLVVINYFNPNNSKLSVNKKISNVVDPVDTQDAATKGYVDSKGSIVLPSKSFLTLTSTDVGTYDWSSSLTIPAGISQADFDSLPANDYGCLTSNLPVSRQTFLPYLIEGYLNVRVVGNDVRYSLVQNTVAISITFIATIISGIWSGWSEQTPVLNSGLVPMKDRLNMGNFKITNVLDPVNDQDAATKVYVDGRTLDAPTSQYQVFTTAGPDSYAWTRGYSFGNILTETQFDTLGSAIYGCYTDYLPATRKGILPAASKGILTVGHYQTTPANIRYTWRPCTNSNSKYISSFVEGVWNTWILI